MHPRLIVTVGSFGILSVLAGGPATGGVAADAARPGLDGAMAASGSAAAAASNAIGAGDPVAASAAADPTSRTGRERKITIPSGTRLPIVLDTTIGSDISRVEQPVSAHLSRPVVIRGLTALPPGTRVAGIVTDATRSARVKGRAHVALRFDSLSMPGDGDRYRIRTSAVGETAPGTKKKDALEIGAPAAGGALIGALVGGKKGALIGGAAGGGAGTAIVLSTRGKEVRLRKGTRLMLRLIEPVTVRAAG